MIGRSFSKSNSTQSWRRSCDGTNLSPDPRNRWFNRF